MGRGTISDGLFAFFLFAGGVALVIATAHEARQHVTVCRTPDGEVLRGWGYGPGDLRDADGFHVQYQRDFRCKTVRPQ